MNNFSRLDKKKRHIFLSKELKILALRTMYHDMSLSKTARLLSQKTLAILKKNSKIKIKNRCFISSRGKGVYSKLGISRIMLRELSHQGLLLGISKSSW